MEIIKSTIESYKIRHAKFDGWADICLDANGHKGRIQIASSHGDWSYYWGACGRPFKLFLRDIDIGYAATKFGESNWFDLGASVESWKRSIIELRKEELIAKEKAREFWGEVEYIEAFCPSTKTTASNLLYNTKLLVECDYSLDLVTGISPSFIWFWENIWESFIGEIKKELEDSSYFIEPIGVKL